MRDIDGVERALNDVSVVSRAEPYAAHEITESGIAHKATMRVPFFANLASCGSPNMSEAHIDQYVDIDTQLTKPGHQYYSCVPAATR